jgi:hypothetical protein
MPVRRIIKIANDRGSMAVILRLIKKVFISLYLTLLMPCDRAVTYISQSYDIVVILTRKAFELKRQEADVVFWRWAGKTERCYLG